MTGIFQFSLHYGLLVAIYAVTAISPILFLGVGIAKPKAFTFLYLSILFFFTSDTSWGVVNPGGLFNIYTRGTGILFFSLVNISLYGIALATTVANHFNRTLPPKYNLRIWIWIFNLMFIGQILVALSESAYTRGHINMLSAIGSHGLINVSNMTILIYVLLYTLRDKDDDIRLMDWLIACVLTRGLWLIFRFMLLGGDPANIYEHAQHIAVRITSFDINDSVLAAISAYYSGWRLADEWRLLAWTRKLYLSSILLVALLVILLSYRRTAWGGLLLVAVAFTLLQPRRRRLTFGLFALLFGIPAIVLVINQRFANGVNESLLDRVLPDVIRHGSVSIQHSRFTELYYAWLTVRHHWIFGLGSWGTYYAPTWLPSLSYHDGSFDFVHSGFGHIFLKSGLIGLTVFSAMFVAYFRFVIHMRSRISKGRRVLVDAAVAGMLFSFPNLLFGTPIIEFRTSQLLGLIFAMPYLICELDRRAKAASLSPSDRSACQV